jgi:hypothetical protein
MTYSFCRKFLGARSYLAVGCTAYLRHLRGLIRGSDRALAAKIRYQKAKDREVFQAAALEVCSWTDFFLPALATELPAIPRLFRVNPGAGPSKGKT